MATQTNARRPSTTAPQTPHSVTLKVLRLSRPSLAPQTPLPAPTPSTLPIPASASLSNPSADPTSTSPLTPLLTLPSSFGAAYVGETFACTLCANCETPPCSGQGDGVSVSGVRIDASLQTPSSPGGVALELSGAQGEGQQGGELPAGGTLQRTLRHALTEEGPHVLAVTVTYTETLRSGGEGGGASGGRARSFRKLYQFVAQGLVGVRSKVSPLPSAKGRAKWVLEAQVDNIGEASVVVESVGVLAREGVKGQRVGGEGDGGGKVGVLKPADVEQVMFVLEQEGEEKGEGGRRLARLELVWRGAMGEKGGLTTGWLGSRT